MKDQPGVFRRPASRKELIDEVREGLNIASARLAEAESVHVQMVSASESLLKSLEGIELPQEVRAAVAELQETLTQERPASLLQRRTRS